MQSEAPLRLPHQYIPNKTPGAFLCKEKLCARSHNHVNPRHTHFVSIAVMKFITFYYDFYIVCIYSICYSTRLPTCLPVGTRSSRFVAYSFAQLQGGSLPQWNIDHPMLEVHGRCFRPVTGTHLWKDTFHRKIFYLLLSCYPRSQGTPFCLVTYEHMPRSLPLTQVR